MTIHVTVWGENVHEHKSALVRSHYPKGMHQCIADALNRDLEIRARTATLDQPEHGLTDEVLESTDVMTWWGHAAHDKVDDAVVDKVQRRVLEGIPGLSDIPVIGKLFAHSHKETQETDIVLTLTPRIIRILDLTEGDLRAFRVGREAGAGVAGSVLDLPVLPAPVALPPAPIPPAPTPQAPNVLPPSAPAPPAQGVPQPQPILPPVCKETSFRTLIFGRTIAQILAFQSSTMMASKSPAFSISIMSSSSSASGTNTTSTGGLPSFWKRAFRAWMPS